MTHAKPPSQTFSWTFLHRPIYLFIASHNLSLWCTDRPDHGAIAIVTAFLTFKSWSFQAHHSHDDSLSLTCRCAKLMQVILVAAILSFQASHDRLLPACVCKAQHQGPKRARCVRRHGRTSQTQPRLFGCPHTNKLSEAVRLTQEHFSHHLSQCSRSTNFHDASMNFDTKSAGCYQGHCSPGHALGRPFAVAQTWLPQGQARFLPLGNPASRQF
jgi:hypothetical protein